MKKQTPTNTVSMTWKNLPPIALVPFVGWIITCMMNNLAFPKPPVPLVPPVPPDPDAPVDMTTRQSSLAAAIAASEDSGSIEMGARNVACEFAIQGLDALALYVTLVARYDLQMLLTSGFQAASTNHAQSPLDTPSITGIDNDISTQLDVHLTTVANAFGYEVQTSTNGTDWKTVQYSSQARSIILTGQPTGTVVQVRARALGGSTGQSDWSMPSSSIVD